MRTLIIIRHGKSSWENPSLTDKQRPLLNKGIKRTEKIADYLQSNRIVPDAIVSSPARRAQETAEIIASELGYRIDNIRIDPSFYFEGSGTIYQAIKQLDNNWQTVFIFGHNPDFTSLVNIFLSKRLFHLPTTGTVILQFDIKEWKDASAESCINSNIIFPRDL